MAQTKSEHHLLVISGPTAVGKTELSIHLAQRYNTVILSADSRQIYKEMNIGTAKPSASVLSRIKHYFINHIDLNTPYSAGHFEREGLDLLQELFERHSVVIVTGGTGLYIDALCHGLDEFPKISTDIKQSVKKDMEVKGLPYLLRELEAKDPEYYTIVDRLNGRRITRALEVIRQSGQPFSKLRKNTLTTRPFQSHFIRLSRTRKELHHRINKRVDDMIKAGLLEEVRSLYHFKHLPALDTVGYRELFQFIDGHIPFDEAIEKIKTNTRRYAKRQETWFRRSSKWQSFEADEVNSIIQWVEKELE